MPLDVSPQNSALAAAFGRVFAARGLQQKWAEIEALGGANALGQALNIAEEQEFIEELAFAMLELRALPQERREVVLAQLIKLFRGALTDEAAGTMQAILANTALSDFGTMLPALLRTGRACARISVRTIDGGTERGSGFLIGDDLLVTAGHVVASLVRPDGKEAAEGDRIEVIFPNRIETPEGLWPSGPLFAAREGWLAFWSPPAGARPYFDAEPGDRLDCALIQLAAPVPDGVPRLDILDPPVAIDGRPLHVLGHLAGGGKLCFDRGLIRALEPRDNRVRHLAAAVPGMSGGPCLDEFGRLLAVHEGAMKAKPPLPKHNRGVALCDVREALRLKGVDPLNPVASAWFIRSREAVEDWARFAEVAFDGRDPRHPIFGREVLRKWIAHGRTGEQPILLVSGAPASGRSFTSRLLRTWLPIATDLLVELPPEVVRGGDAHEVIARCDAALGVPTMTAANSHRAPAGELRLDLLNPALDRWGAQLDTGPFRRIWIAADLGGPDAWKVDTVKTLWCELLRLAVPRRKWLRIAILGIGGDVASALWNNIGVARKDVQREPLDELDWDDHVWPVARETLKLLGRPFDQAAYGARFTEWQALIAKPGARRPVECVRLVKGI